MAMHYILLTHNFIINNRSLKLVTVNDYPCFLKTAGIKKKITPSPISRVR